ncbi:hypothetical protein GUITHDRAFT_106647 [Guillardia theta CCMP2712]|uniref:Spindle pole body component n=1 Tax=Guillardia theta (strain CCMP2712) TaxID=905079 RepID=L1JGK8_GUITC|nr:hypothetical protein GUITHDRAFT_106647 [Guillardia theta CCMP2712]EKX47658.1 hypothetical protein GUITHDRAFT_106647 [Guillardia theta CCMP2712]|eukprot:XP_005834638.1 hypothetical protein GUITHDRAFT_106647 [Guillardia theta CCMP2712]
MVYHEVLFALLGHPGSIVCEAEDESNKGYVVNKHAKFLADSEKVKWELLTRIAAIGYNYSVINSFIKDVQQNMEEEKPKDANHKGLYLRAFVSGLNEMLDVYRSTVLRVEQALIEDPGLSLTYLLSEAADFEILFPYVKTLIQDIGKLKSHGCQMLDLVSKHSCSGISVVQYALEKVLGRMNIVLYSQVSAWMIYGILSDPHGEFFISPRQRRVEERQLTGGTSHQRMSGKHHEDQLFELNLRMKPGILSAVMLEKILFCGVAMRVLMQPNTRPEDRPEAEQIGRFNGQMKAISKEGSFHRNKFESLVDEVHQYLSKRLWRLVVERARLPLHFKALKDYFLLARGDLYQAFIENTRGLLSLPASDTAEHDVNEPFRRAALLSYADEDEMFARTRLVIGTLQEQEKVQGDKGEQGEEEGLDKLRMAYDMEWPLSTLLFTPEVMKQYNILFSFLLRVKRAQAELQFAWHQTQSGRYGRAISSVLHKASSSGRHMVNLWTVRAEMAFLVNNLLYYLQCDVLDAQFEIARNVIRSSDDFETIRAAHVTFLERISSDCLTRNKLAWQTVNILLKIALNFARRMSQWKTVEKGIVSSAESRQKFTLGEAGVGGAEGNGGVGIGGLSYLGCPITVNGELNVITNFSEEDREVTVYKPLKTSVSGDMEPCAEDLIGARYSIEAPSVTGEELSEIRLRFQRNALLLFTVLKTSQAHTTPVLSQLLLRMDYNGFFEQSKAKWQQTTSR